MNYKVFLDLNTTIIIPPHLSLMGACLSAQQERANQQNLPQAERTIAQPKEPDVLCHICMNNIPRKDSSTLTCGHIFGKDCLAQAYTIKIR
jgi:hypothetical protein